MNTVAAEPEIVWMDIPNHLGYRVSNTGIVESCWYGTRVRRMTDTWKRIKSSINGDGYLGVKLTVPIREGKTSRQRSVFVQVLVLEAFSGPRPLNHMAIHKNDIKTDNRLDNLKWGTCLENWLDAKRNGRAAIGDRHRNAKIKSHHVLQIRQMIADGVSLFLIGECFGLTAQTIHALNNGRSWKHIVAECQECERLRKRLAEFEKIASESAVEIANLDCPANPVAMRLRAALREETSDTATE